MATEGTYHVPEQSKLPIAAATGLGLFALGAGQWVQGQSPMVFLAGILLFCATLYVWFSTTIKENMAGMNSDQLKRSYVWGISWFIFSEVMFFAGFFGALFYIRQIALPELSAPLESELLWNGFQADWPLMVTPDMALNGDAAEKFVGPHENMGFLGWDKILHWLPLWNTLILMTSSVTVHFAHTALKKDNRKGFITWLGLTVALGMIFLYVQYLEYHEALFDMGLTLSSGAYGTTFFMLTGFHGFHVAMGTFMLLVQLIRAIKGHFSHDDAFGFEASSWYWHFVDVVWVGLFIFVYILGS